MLAFSSMGVNNDKGLATNTNGIYTFRVQGQIYHFIDDLLPRNEGPKYLQLYFYDTEHAIENRSRFFSSLRPDIISMLVDVLARNPDANFFRSLREFDINEESQILLKRDDGLDQRVFNTPIASQVAAIWLDENASKSRQIIVF